MGIFIFDIKLSAINLPSGEGESMSIIGKIFFCLRGKHTRSRRFARSTSAGMVSVCQNCDRPMRKNMHQKWEIVSDL